MENLKKILKISFEAIFFFGVMFLSLYTVFEGQDIKSIWAEIRNMSIVHLILALFLAILFISFEGIMFYYLIHPMDKQCRFIQCLDYCFIGFFYSSITPSASGGQPMQLYYMAKDGRKFGTSFVVLMIIATMNKLVLTFLGINLLIFAKPVLDEYLAGYETLFYIGLSLDIMWVGILFALMVFTEPLRKLILTVLYFIFKRNDKIRTKSSNRINDFFRNYRHSLSFIKEHPFKITMIFFMSVLQRVTPILIIVCAYFGLGVRNVSAGLIMIMQSAIYVTVDMLPLPGAQGVTEAMFREVFVKLIPAANIMSTMYVTRGVNFYFLLLFSGIVVLRRVIASKKFLRTHKVDVQAL